MYKKRAHDFISYFARRILEGVFVGSIVNIRNECLFFLGSREMNRSAEQANRVNCDLFFSVHGKWIAVRNKQIAREPLRGSRDSFVPHCDSFPMNREKRHSFLKKITFSIYTCIYISFTCCWVRLNLITSKTKKEGGTRGFVPLLLDRTSAQISLNIWSYIVV